MKLQSSDAVALDGRTSDRAAFRGDIEGLRGLAVAAVVLYHARLSWFSGGYVGVDVFFVLSGFLITGLIVDERGRSGSLRFGHFFARRVRRLLPTSTLVFVSTVLLSVLVLDPLQLSDLRSQARAVALFASNIWFSIHATDYLQPDLVSPFQQYWSLAVEEQFYLVWPFVIGAACIGAANRRAVYRRVIGVVAVVVVASFALAVWWTGVRQPSAFFLLPPRAWELGAGALLAVALRSGLRIRSALAPMIGWLGLLAIVASVVLYSDRTLFPGWTALAPVLGTVAVLAAGSVEAGSDRFASGLGGRALSSRALRWLGRYSYSLYLWHWPLLVLWEARGGGEVSAAQRLAVVAVSVGVSVATYHLIENRMRFSAILMRSSRISLVAALPMLALALSSTVLLTSRPIAVAGSADPVTETSSEIVEGKRSDHVPADLTPSIEGALEDTARIYGDGCHRVIPEVETGEPPSAGSCEYGLLTGHEIRLVGDSHAAHWFPAFESAANAHGWKLRSTTKSTCPLAEIDVYMESLKREYTECNVWRAATIADVETNPPSVLVLAQKSGFYRDQVGLDKWLAGLRVTVERLSKVTDVVVLRDLPHANTSVPNCLSVNLQNVSPCEFKDTSDQEELASEERAVVEEAGGHYLDPVGIVCPKGSCPVVVGNILVFMDKHHMTATFARTLAEPLATLLEREWSPR